MSRERCGRETSSRCNRVVASDKQTKIRKRKMKVHNINGTSDNTCKCGSWKAHWEDYNEKGQSWPKYCSEKSCLQSPTVGAHVQKEDITSAKWYIIPLCKTHNDKFGETIEVSDNTAFASANRSETCEKANSK